MPRHRALPPANPMTGLRRGIQYFGQSPITSGGTECWIIRFAG
jgi:hypothetical protein